MLLQCNKSNCRLQACRDRLAQREVDLADAWYVYPITYVDMHALAVSGALGLADAAAAEIEYGRTPHVRYVYL